MSIDRTWRWDKNRILKKAHEQTAIWWEGEAPIYDSNALDLIPQGIRIDTVVSYSAPSFCKMNEKMHLLSWAENDDKLLDDIATERETMEQIYRRLVSDGHPIR